MEEPFYASGLSFECTRCSRCCTGEPGYVFLSREDLAGLLGHLSLDFRGFYTHYCKVVNMGEDFALSLRERRDNSCVFWTKEGCSVYSARPLQCRSYPFWSTILASPREWQREGDYCPGLGKGGFHQREEIETALLARRVAGRISLSPEEAKRPELLDEDKILGR